MKMSNSAEASPACPACTCITTITNNEDNDCSLHAEFNEFNQICKFSIEIRDFATYLGITIIQSPLYTSLLGVLIFFLGSGFTILLQEGLTEIYTWVSSFRLQW